ncbi:hypothetical protein ES703_00266 [subsurface metagenome]
MRKDSGGYKSGFKPLIPHHRLKMTGAFLMANKNGTYSFLGTFHFLISLSDYTYNFISVIHYI